MIVDKLLSPAIGKKLADFTVSTQVVGGVMDFGVAMNLGNTATGENGWVIDIGGATSGGAATLTLKLVTSATAVLGAPTTLWQSTTFALADINAAKEQKLFIPIENSDRWLRYAAFQATVGVAVFTGGELNIQYVAERRMWRAYPSVLAGV